MELIPKNALNGTTLWNEKQSVALSPEEMGFVLSNHFDQSGGMELTRNVSSPDGYTTTASQVKKVFKIIPSEEQDDDYSYKVSIEFIKDGSLSEEEIQEFFTVAPVS